MDVLLHNKPYSLLEIFDVLTTPVFTTDGNRRIITANSSALVAFRCSLRDIVGREYPEVIFPRESTFPATEPPALPSYDSLDEHGSAAIQFESVCRKRTGETFPAQIAVIPVGDDNRKMVIVRDISHQRRLQMRASQRSKELLVFNTFADIVARQSDTRTILQETIEMLISLMEADSGWVYLYDEERAELLLTAHKGISGDYIAAASRYAPGMSFTGKVFSSGRTLLVRQASEDPRTTERDEGIESMIGVPIVFHGLPLGVLGIASKKLGYFTALDIQLLSNIGTQLGVTIENIRLIRQLQKGMKQIGLINELSSTINSSLSIGTIFRIMVAEIRKLIEYSRASLLLYNEEEQNLLIFALDTEMKTVLRKGVTAPLEATSAGWVIRNNQPWINTDLSQKLSFPLDAKLLREGIHSTVSIPLHQDKILGVFNLDSTEPNRYSEKDLEVLQPVAKHISIALENALLFEAISREKKEWERTFDAITDMVWIEDENRRVIRANHTLLGRTGLSARKVAGKPCPEIFERIGIYDHPCMRDNRIESQQPAYRELKGAGGTLFHYWVYPLLNEDGRLYAFVHYLKDATDQKRLEQQLIRADKLASLGTLVAGIAHEINNPLGIIAGYAEALLDRADSPSLLKVPEFEDFPEYLETIHKEIFRCKKILGSLLDFSRPPAGSFREIDINELIKEVILLVNHHAARMNHTIELRLNRDLPKILAEPGSLRQLFMNIIINSMYYTPEKGTIFITSELDRSTPERRPLADTPWIKVSVTDTGQGIPADILDKIFDPFFTTKPAGEGTGLGLAICHRIVEEHQGTIDAESDPDSGTTFNIRFPAKILND